MSSPDAAARLGAIRQRLEAATPGPWRMHLRHVHWKEGDFTQDEMSGLGWDFDEIGVPPEPQLRGILSRGADAALISHMHEDIAWLLAALDAANERVAAAEKALREYHDKASVFIETMNRHAEKMTAPWPANVVLGQLVEGFTNANALAAAAREPATEGGDG